MGEGSASTRPEVHDYRSLSANLSSVVLLVISAFIITMLAEGWSSLQTDVGGHMVSASESVKLICFVVTAAPFVLADLYFAFALLKVWFERITVTSEEIEWRSRFGRVRSLRIADIVGFERRTGQLALRPYYSISTRIGEIRFSPEISRRSDLERLSRSMLGETLPVPVPLPREWQGHTVYRWKDPMPLLIAAVVTLAPALQIRNYVRFRWHADAWLWLAVVECLVVAGFVICKLSLESVTIGNGEISSRNFLGIVRRIPLDELESVDVSCDGRFAKLYTRTGKPTAIGGLQHFADLVGQLRYFTASIWP